MIPDLGRVLFEHRKADGTTVRVAVRSYRGREFLDVREWKERDGVPVVTAKGATLPLAVLRELGKALLEPDAGRGAGAAPAAS